MAGLGLLLVLLSPGQTRALSTAALKLLDKVTEHRLHSFK